jgi:hypothetical protein
MTPEQKIKQLIVIKVCKWEKVQAPPMPDGDTVDAMYAEYAENQYPDAAQDIRNEIRCGEEYTGFSVLTGGRLHRDYDADSVAAQMHDGSWVGWVYWQGGGRHGEPGAINWMSDAYEVTCTEAEKVIIERKFTKV